MQITDGCREVGGEIDYEARSPDPRSFEVDHVVSSEEAKRRGWTPVEADALDNCAGVCRECNREKSDGLTPVASARPTYINPRFT